jgi:hypothetical protein
MSIESIEKYLGEILGYGEIKSFLFNDDIS